MSDQRKYLFPVPGAVGVSLSATSGGRLNCAASGNGRERGLSGSHTFSPIPRGAQPPHNHLVPRDAAGASRRAWPGTAVPSKPLRPPAAAGRRSRARLRLLTPCDQAVMASGLSGVLSGEIGMFRMKSVSTDLYFQLRLYDCGVLSLLCLIPASSSPESLLHNGIRTR